MTIPLKMKKMANRNSITGRYAKIFIFFLYLPVFNLFAILYSLILNFYSTEKPRKPYGSGVSYVWTHVPCGTQYILVSDYSMIVATRPDPTVRPPSRIAKVRPCSIAIGWISSIVISTLSPGMHISVPSGRLITPVTSVVLK